MGQQHSYLQNLDIIQPSPVYPESQVYIQNLGLSGPAFGEPSELGLSTLQELADRI